ncbi:putative sugar nucleotidyl transferase [Blattabacterium cuenoti]|uniref:putative sugar nucleotidyl transferase n=1 Tax=Blattabacterium cuenoti TaxID=1653831 RepID=UPI00163C9ACF|nr:putative sugar nucleotidyl transferase [Blattabacterium cuenoti]
MENFFILYDGFTEWKKLLPITFTRPISEIRLGIFTIKERWKKYLRRKAFVFTLPFLSKKYGKMNIINEELKDVLFINSSFIPNEELIQLIFKLNSNEAILFNKKIVAIRKDFFPIESYSTTIMHIENMHALKKVYYINKILEIQYPWDLFLKNEIVLNQDFFFLTKGRKSFSLFGNNHILSKKSIFLEEDMIAENIVLNAKLGPIYIDTGVQIMEGTIIKGPVAICNSSILNMGTRIYGATTIGPFCKVGGEIMNSIILSYSNKAHDGFLGNTILGEWCNLGAGTNISNLRNDYSNVSIWDYEKKIFLPVNLQFLGMIMGDYSKSSINTQFNTGTMVGVNANVFGYGFPPRNIPSFSFGGIQDRKTIPFQKVCEMADMIMKRRKISFSILEKDILKHLYTSIDKDITFFKEEIK